MVEAAGELEHSLEMQKVYRHMAPWIPGRLGETWEISTQGGAPVRQIAKLGFT